MKHTAHNVNGSKVDNKIGIIGSLQLIYVADGQTKPGEMRLYTTYNIVGAQNVGEHFFSQNKTTFSAQLVFI